MNKSKLPLILVGIGIFTVLISGIPEIFTFQALGDTLMGIIFIIIGLLTYKRLKDSRTI